MPTRLRPRSSLGVDPAEATAWRVAMSFLDTLTDDMAAAVLLAVEGWQEDLAVGTLAAFVEANDASGLARLLFGDADTPALAALTRALRNAIETVMAAEAARLSAAGLLTTLRSRAVGFNALHPAVVTASERRMRGLLAHLKDGAIRGVEQVLRQGIRDGVAPAEVARRLVQTKALGLPPHAVQAIASYRTALEGGPRATVYSGALARTLRDRRADTVLRRAQATGVPLDPAYVDSLVARYAERMRRHVAMTVARTELLQTYTEARHSTWRDLAGRGILGGRLRKRWVLALDERTCPVCRAIAANQPAAGVPLDGTFAGPNGETYDGPIAHPNCRCITVLDIDTET